MDVSFSFSIWHVGHGHASIFDTTILSVVMRSVICSATPDQMELGVISIRGFYEKGNGCS